jgi:Mycothiol maleylpyruvate isomerase N-terminal domain
MTGPVRKTVLTGWASIPRDVRRAIAGLSNRDLKARGGSEGWSIREYVHHLVEANLVASNIILAALGRPGCKYDWSWVIPDKKWMKRLGYDRVPLEPAIQLLEALCAHVVGVARDPGSMNRYVRLLDSPGARLRRRTLRQVLDDERDHARHHLRDIADTRKALDPLRKGRARSPR